MAVNGTRWSLEWNKNFTYGSWAWLLYQLGVVLLLLGHGRLYDACMFICMSVRSILQLRNRKLNNKNDARLYRSAISTSDNITLYVLFTGQETWGLSQ